MSEDHPYKAIVDRSLARFGGFYEFDDILDFIDRGEMQSFAYGDSWAVTQICDFPRKRAVDVVLVVGSVEELTHIEEQIVEFAKKHEIDTLMANGRLGFDKIKTKGWKVFTTTFIKDISDAT